MKSFGQFIIEALGTGEVGSPKRGTKLPGESTADFIKRVRGVDISGNQNAKLADDPDVYDPRTRRGKNTNVKTADAGLGGKKQSSTSNQTLPKGTQAAPPSSTAIVKSDPSALSQAPKPSAPKPSAPKPNAIKNLKGLKGGSVLSGVIDTALEKSSGSGWARSLAKGTASALGALGGGALGSAAGPVGTVVGGAAGSMAAGKAFDTVAGANAVGRKAIATDNRKSQSGGGLVGTGGKTTFDTKKNTITSGGKTAQLGKTSVVNDPKTGKQGVGYLAYKGGKAVYKRPDTKSLAQTSSNPLERIGRSLFAGAYKDNDAKLATTKLAAARASDATRNQKLGVKLKPGG